MATPIPHPNPEHHALVRGGPAYRFGQRLGLAQPGARRRVLKVVLLILLTWVPLLVLSWLDGHLMGFDVTISLLRDPVVYTRFLFVVPLLELADMAVATGLATQVGYFMGSGLLPERELPRFEAARANVVRLRNSTTVEVAIFVLALAISCFARLVLAASTDESTWERVGDTMTPAGMWYTLVSLPVLFFFLLRWTWVLFLWGWFLARVARLELALSPTHPDRAGGLGFLSWGLISFATVLMAISAVVSGGFAYEIMHRGGSLQSLKYHVAVYVVVALLVLHLPLFTFVGKLSACRWQGLLEFGALCNRHDRAFDQKWVKNPDAARESLLGNPDISSLADIEAAYERVQHMRVVPFDKGALLTLAAAALLPMVPLVGTAIPVQDILSKLAVLML